MLRAIISVFCAISLIAAAGGPGAEAPRRPLPFFYDLYTFRGTGSHTDVIASFAVPVGELERETKDGEVQYRFDVSLVLADTALRSVYRTDDSVFVGVPRRLGGKHLLHTHIQVAAAPSVTTLQRVVMTDASTPGIGQLYTHPFTIPDYSGAELMLSDIALGVPDSKTGWTRGDATLALLPTSQFPQGSFDLYYEIYNLPAGHRYATQISIEPVDETGEAGSGDAAPVGTRFTGEAATDEEGLLAELRRVDASLPNGSYLLTVTVTDEITGLSARQSRPFQVKGWDRGTTMVPALPRRG